MLGNNKYRLAMAFEAVDPKGFGQVKSELLFKNLMLMNLMKSYVLFECLYARHGHKEGP